MDRLEGLIEDASHALEGLTGEIISLTPRRQHSLHAGMCKAGEHGPWQLAALPAEPGYYTGTLYRMCPWCGKLEVWNGSGWYPAEGEPCKGPSLAERLTYLLLPEDDPENPRDDDLLVEAVKHMKDDLEGHRAFKRRVDEALNSGDGAYRP